MKDLKDDKGEPLDGHCLEGDLHIKIEKSLSPAEKRQTFFHELGHALFARIGIGQTEIHPDLIEIIVENYGTLLEETFTWRVK